MLQFKEVFELFQKTVGNLSKPVYDATIIQFSTSTLNFKIGTVSRKITKI